MELSGFQPIRALNGGLDYPMGDSSWSLHGGLSYLFVDVKDQDNQEAIGVNPFQLKVGFTYNF